MALDFPGLASDREIDLGNLDLPAMTGALSLTAWVNVTNYGGGDEASILVKGDNTGSSKDWALQAENPSSSPLRAYLDTGAGGKAIDGTSTLTAGIWFFCAMTYDGTTKRVYVNAVEENSNTANSGDVNNSAKPTRIATVQAGTGARELDGLADDIRIYDRALSPAELTTMFTLLGKDGIVFGLLHRWEMREKAPGQNATVANSIKDFGSALFDGSPNNTPIYIAGILR